MRLNDTDYDIFERWRIKAVVFFPPSRDLSKNCDLSFQKSFFCYFWLNCYF